MIRKTLVVLLASTLLLGGCDSLNWWNGDKAAHTTSATPAPGQTSHAAAKTAPTLSGVLFGQAADENDLKQANAAEAKAYMAPIGQQITWSNADNGDSGKIIPIKDGYSQAGAYCREFQETAIVGGQQKQGHGTACQQPDGSWKILSP